MAPTERIPQPARTLRSKASFLRPRLWQKSSSHIDNNKNTQHVEHTQPTITPRAVYVPTYAASSFASSTALRTSVRRPSRPISGESRASKASPPTRHAIIEEGCRQEMNENKENKNTIEETAEESADFAAFLAAAEVAERSRFRTLHPPDPVPRQPPGLDAIPRNPRCKTTAQDASLPNRDSAYSSAGPSIASHGSSPSPCPSATHPVGQQQTARSRTVRRQQGWGVQRITDYIKPAPLETHQER